MVDHMLPNLNGRRCWTFKSVTLGLGNLSFKPLPPGSLILSRANSLHIHVPYWVHVHIFQATVKDCQNDNEGDG